MAPEPAHVSPEYSGSAHDACNDLVARIRSLESPHDRDGMGRFGINVEHAYGVSVTTLRSIAREVLRERRKDYEWRHELAGCLWATGVHEAELLATIIDIPALVTRRQALAWASASESWDTTDLLVGNLLDKTEFAYDLAFEWSSAQETFLKRAGFVLMARLAVHDKKAVDEVFLPFLEPIRREAHDERNFVKKSINWALRQIGKRSAQLHGPALELARELSVSEDRTERWVGRDAARELRSDGVLQRVNRTH